LFLFGSILLFYTPLSQFLLFFCAVQYKHVVDSDSVESESKQQQHDSEVTAKNCSKTDLIEGIAGIFVADGDTAEVATPKAVNLIEKYGQEQCQRQLDVFARRCELAQASEEGLRNPSGLFIRSVQ
jgi:hypothetical protein